MFDRVNEFTLGPNDFELISANEQVFRTCNGIELVQEPVQLPVKEFQTARIESTRSSPTKVAKPQSKSRITSAPSSPFRKRLRDRVKIFDFDALFAFLNTIAHKSDPNSAAEEVLSAAKWLYKSNALFYKDFSQLKSGGEQPYLLYYSADDNMASFPENVFNFFDDDDLGRFARGRSFSDQSRKFYLERAQRCRFLATQPPAAFFPESKDRSKIRCALIGLKQKYRQFDEFLNELFAVKEDTQIFLICQERGFFESLALLIVLFLVSPEPVNDHRPVYLMDRLWSARKFGLNWTLDSILKLAKCERQDCELITLHSWESGPLRPLFPRITRL